MSGLLGIVFSILSYVFIILFVFNLLKIDYYNPIVKAFLNFYKPISLISIFSNQIYTIFLVAVILKCSGCYILYSSQYDHYVLGIVSVIEVINTTLTIFFFSIIGAVILSWVAPNNPNPILKIIEEISDKLLAPIRKFIPALGGLDFSPIFALILIRQLEIFLASIVRSII